MTNYLRRLWLRYKHNHTANPERHEELHDRVWEAMGKPENDDAADAEHIWLGVR